MWRRSLAVTRVSSTAMRSQPASVAAARGLRSERLPIGVATIYRPGERRGFMRKTLLAEQRTPRQARAALRLAAALLLGLAASACALVPAPRAEAPPVPTAA